MAKIINAREAVQRQLQYGVHCEANCDRCSRLTLMDCTENNIEPDTPECRGRQLQDHKSHQQRQSLLN